MRVVFTLSILLVRSLHPFLDRSSPQNHSFLKTPGYTVLGRFLLEQIPFD
jgi:hypothetical protein